MAIPPPYYAQSKWRRGQCDMLVAPGMDAVARLETFLRALLRRFRLLALLRGLSAVTVTALALSTLLAWYLSSRAPSPRLLLVCRLALVGGLAGAALLGLWLPLRRCRMASAIQRAERRWPPFGSRLRTLATILPSAATSPLVPFLAEEALELAPKGRAGYFVARRTLAAVTGAAILPAAALALWLAAPRGPIGQWEQALWGLRQPFTVEVKGERAKIARGRSLGVTAHTHGFTTPSATLWVRPAGERKWRRIPMQPDGPDAFRATVDELAGDVEYCATAEGVRSATLPVQAVELPLVTHVETDYADDRVQLTIDTDRPMSGGELVASSGKSRALPDTRENRIDSLLALEAGRYSIGVRHLGELVPVSDEFDIVMYERWAPKSPHEDVPPAFGGSTDRIPPGYERAVREYFRLLNRQPR